MIKDTGEGLGAPLGVPLFRRLWAGNTVSNLGWLIQSVAAAWLMTELVGTADWVALVQSALLLPMLLFALPAGVLADVGDRRVVCMVGQGTMFVAAALLGICTWLDMTGPILLLAFTFVLGAGSAFANTPFQTIVREVVPLPAIAAAVTLNAISFNLARSVGPALGGILVASVGAEAAFLTNALCYLPLLLVLAFWKRPTARVALRGKMVRALGDGLRFAKDNVKIRAVLAYCAVFSLCASSIQGLLPLVARDRLDGDAVTFGLLLGAFGIGAMGGAFLVHPARRRFGTGPVVTWLGLQLACSTLVIAFSSDLVVLAVALALSGVGWLGSFSSFNIAVQQASASGLEARQLALYQTITFGSMAAGSWLWGEIAHLTAVTTSMAMSGIVLLVGTGLAFRLVRILARS
ncbi:MFS transporter, partial [Geminicoccus roseus]|uniref:MFS transporter n=1 Tax=Geminicoccus roseus TaxID=404900 RepID=UPI00041F5AC9